MFSIITIAASIIAPMAIAMPPSDMISAPTPTQRIATNAMRMPDGQRDDRDEGRAYMKQEHHADQRDDDRFLEQLALERRDRALE